MLSFNHFDKPQWRSGLCFKSKISTLFIPRTEQSSRMPRSASYLSEGTFDIRSLSKHRYRSKSFALLEQLHTRRGVKIWQN